MVFQKFEDVIAWQKAQDIAVDIYSEFGSIKDFSFKDQITRASVSISNNIAEGFDRMSDTEFIRFLYISSASCSEVKSMLYLAFRLKYLNLEKRDELIEKSTEISKIIKGLINAINKNRKN